MTPVVARWLVCVMAVSIATAARAELRDLGRYGPTCPMPDAPPSRVGLRVRVDPALARVSAPVEPSMPLAPTRRTYRLPGRWPAGAPSIVAFVGQDAASLATVRTLPSGTPVFVLPSRWTAGASSIVAFVGDDAASLAIVRALPPGTPVFVLPSEGGTGLEALRQACPGCRIGMAGPAGARRLGIQAVPAVIRAADGVAHVTEGPP